jgi:hypothetical protein
VLGVLRGGLTGVGRTVDRPDRRAVDAIGAYVARDELLEHADLDGAPAAAAGEDERGALRGAAVPPATIGEVATLRPSGADTVGERRGGR